MDARRLLTLAASATLAACSTPLHDHVEVLALTEAKPVETAVQPEPAPAPAPSPTEIPYRVAAQLDPPPEVLSPVVRPASVLSGRRAIAAANAAARAPSREDDFVGGVQRFAWSPGRVFEVWAAPMRVTTLTLGAGEALVAKAAGDTVRWQIGEAASGEGASLRTHVLLKPLERGLETNLVLTTNRRIYLIDLKSGSPDAYNTAVAWDEPAPEPLQAPGGEDSPSAGVLVALPEGELDGRYRIEAGRRPPRWTPTSVFNDGRRTFITFPQELQTDEAPVLFVIAADGQAQLVNYRQTGGLFVIDRLFDRAELRLGDRRPQVVRLVRTGGRS